MICYSNNGYAMRSVSENYISQDGEALFPDYATIEQLNEAFPLYNSGVLIKTKAQKLSDLNTEYDTEINALKIEFAGAGLANSTADVVQAKQLVLIQQRVDLLAEKTAKRSAILNG